MKQLIIICLLVLHAAGASAQVLTLQAFLEEVKSNNPDARAALEGIASYESRLYEGDLILSPELYADLMRRDDKKPTAEGQFAGGPPMHMQGTQTDVTFWDVGVRKQTTFGLGADLYFKSQRTIISNAPAMAMLTPDYMESSFNLDLKQSLWRNGFGEATRAQRDAKRAENEAALLENKFRLKDALLNAQNIYWGLVSTSQTVKLQQENVARAKRLFDYMSQRSKMKLVDDTDAMQAQASLETRELELQKSLDDRAQMIRVFNSLRGLYSDELPGLEDLPLMKDVGKNPSGRMTREDFEQLRAKARMALSLAKKGKSEIQPKLDLVAGFSTNGRDGTTSASYYQAGTDRYPTWSVGVNFSMPLDFFLWRDVNRGLARAQSAADYAAKGAEFNEAKLWTDLLSQKKEALGRYERAVSIERLQTELVKRERTRLMNGRTTTFEAITFEQNLALAQIQRVKNQLDLLQIYNSIKTFEAKP